MAGDFFVSRGKLLGSFEAMRARLPTCRMLYALKANGEREVLQILAEAGSGFDVASAEELEKLLDLGVDPDLVMCSLPAKPRAMLARVVAGGCSHFVFDTLAELAKIVHAAPAARRVLRVLISDVDSDSFPLGMHPDELRAAIAAKAIDLAQIDGLTFHASRNYRLQNLERVLARCREVLAMFPGDRPLIVNIGGGYRHELPFHLAQRFELDKFYAYLNAWLDETAASRPCVFYCEPGRGIVESACYVECDVVLTNQRPALLEAFVDANIGKQPGGHPSRIDVVHASGELEQVYDLAWHMAPTDDAPRWQTRFLDTVCEYTPLYTLPLKRPLVEGERLRLDGMGAYTVSCTHYLHARARPVTRVIP